MTCYAERTIVDGSRLIRLKEISELCLFWIASRDVSKMRCNLCTVCEELFCMLKVSKQGHRVAHLKPGCPVP